MATMSTITKTSIFTKSFPQIPTSSLPSKSSTVRFPSASRSYNGINGAKLRSTQRVHGVSKDVEKETADLKKQATRGAEDVGDAVKEASNYVKDGVANLTEQSETQAKAGSDEAGKAAETVKETLADVAGKANKGLSDAWDKATETSQKVKESVVEKAQEAKKEAKDNL